MASNFIPMLSASPPPLDDTGSIDDDDDDFHDFLSASKVLDSPSDSPVKTPPDSTPAKTNLPIEKTAQLKTSSEENLTISVQNDDKDNLDSISITNFQTSHNDNDNDQSPELNSSKEFTEFYTCSSKTTDDDLDFNIPPSNGFSEDEFETVSKSECDTETLNFEINSKNIISQPPVPQDEDLHFDLDRDDDDDDKESVPRDEEYVISCDNTADIPIPNEVEPPQSIENFDDDDDEDDDFADFETAAFAKEEYCETVASLAIEKDEYSETVTSFTKEKDESFADFATASFDHDHDENEMQESFTEFETAGSDNQWADFTSGSTSHLDIQDTSLPPGQLLQIFTTAFPISNDENSFTKQEEVLLQKLSDSLKSASASASASGASGAMIWPKLEDLDQSLSLRHQWIGSEAFQKTLQSLNIDSRNILRNPSIPLFALGLGPLLEPVKVDTGLEETTSYSIKPSSPNSLEPHENFIPPAQFDWNSSGLVNPLDPTQSSSSLLDLDFFNADYASTSKSVAKTFSLEEELLGHDSKFDFSSPQSSNAPSQQTILLEQLMSNIKLTNSSTLPPNRKRSENLSEGAIQILKRIPDLSFVKAKVLMFPVHSDEVS